MILARFLSKFFEKEGIVLIDSEGQKYICGEVKNKEKFAKEIGINSEVIKYSKDIKEKDLLDKIVELNSNNDKQE